MQETFEIDAVARADEGKGASRRLRRTGMVPGIIYGGGKDPEMIATNHNVLQLHLENEAFYSHILTVNLAGNKQKVVLKDLQRHPAKPFVLHFDLLRVSASDRIRMTVPLHFLNESTSPGTKAGGKLSHAMTDVEVVCAARDLPEYIELDLGQMDIGDIMHLTDLKLPEGVEIVTLQQGEGHDLPVVNMHMPRVGSDEDEEGEGEGEGEGAAEDTEAPSED